MSAPLRVTIVRPDGRLVDFIAGSIALVLRAWSAMLCLGALFPEVGISYGQTFLGLLVVGAATPRDYIYWTKSPESKP